MQRSIAMALCLVALSFGGVPRSVQASPVAVHCVVFQDLDGNGQNDGEPPLAGIRLTNGVTITTTDGAGQADLSVDRTLYRFATLTVPAGYRPTTPWFARVDGLADSLTVEFGLAADPASASDPIEWVHIADTQVDTWSDPWRMDDVLVEVNALPTPPLFLMNAGDLVMVGSDTTHWDNYVSQLALSDYEVLPVVGNHDTVGTAEPLALYEQYAGPPYYSREAGSWHFTIYNVENAAVGTPAQDTWFDADAAAAPPGSHLVVCEHRMLKEGPAARNAHWQSMGVLANFSGHWHSLQFAENPTGILELNLSRTRSGPLDWTPLVFGVVTMSADGTIEYDLRRFGVDHRIATTFPPSAGTVAAGEAFGAMVQAYDSSSPVASVTLSVSGPGGTVGGTALSAEGVSLWRGDVDVSALPPGTYDLQAVATFQDGQVRIANTVVVLDEVVPIVRTPSASWPMFRRCAAGSSATDHPLDPPLELAWTTPATGMVALSSPVVDGGRVFLGTRAEHVVGEEGMIACDAATGAVLWERHVPGGVALAPAVAGGVVVATALSDSVWGLSAATGAILWNRVLNGARYNMTAPVFEGTTAWVGAEPQPLQVDVATGAMQWAALPALGSPWFPYIYSAPAVGATYLYFGFHGYDANTGGFSVVDRVTGGRQSLEVGTFRSPIWTGETLYVVGGADKNDQRLTARDVSGVVQWTAPWNLGGGTGSPALARGTVVVPGFHGTVEALRASDGAHLWSHAVGDELYQMEGGLRWGRGTPATPAIAADVVWVGSLDGFLYALDLATGAERWKYFLGTPVASSVAIAGNMLFVGASDGHLYAFTSASSPVGTAAPVTGTGRASTFHLYAVAPNPSRDWSTIAWTQTRSSEARVEIYDLAGRRVRRLVREMRSAGEHEVRWDGRTDGGKQVAAGVYFVRLRTDEGERVRKTVRLAAAS